MAAQIDYSRWICVYPSYINSNVTVALGRRVPKSVAVPDPHPHEISEVLQFLKLHHVIENKAYSRDILVRGRIRVRLRDDAGNPVNPEISTRKGLLNKLCQYIPRLKSRVTTEESKQTTTKDKKKKKNKKK
jgi:signal recognition particle subunit SRP19